MSGIAQYGPVTSARVALIGLLVVGLLTPALAGCVAKRPTIVVAVKAASEGLENFATLDVTIRQFYIQQEGKLEPEFVSIDPVTVDVVQLTSAREVARAPVDPGSYAKIGITVASVRATTLTGETPRVSFFSNLLYGIIPFNAGKGETKTFTLALSVDRNRETGDLILVKVDAETTLK